MSKTIYQVDSFTEVPFKGNPAGVMVLEKELPDSLMQNIAMENNLSETAFFVNQGESYRLRWFTPVAEVDLCGHATLASAHVLFEHLGYEENVIRFDSNSGELKVKKDEDRLIMDFPSSNLEESETPAELEEALGITASELFKADDYLCVVDSEDEVRNLDPDFRLLKRVDTRGIIVTAPGEDFDFVSRFFAPAVGIDEDPVTGSAHTMLTPYWSERLGKKELTGRQSSKRGGTVYCHQKGDRVELGGEAQTFMKGQIAI
jgi:PhzF family phenazine biosynthesis protein